MRPETVSGSTALRQLILRELTAEQRAAVETPYQGSFAIVGAPGSGKSTALAERIARLRQMHPGVEPLVLGIDRSVEDFAGELLASRGKDTVTIDDVEAELLFADACAPLFSLEWQEFAREQLDPEVPALRTPRRFLRSAFRLIRRLRDADVSPEFFLSRALAGATEFYANPPNLADPALLSYTRPKYHDSLAPRGPELQRQRLREIDLAKILAKLYERYIELVESTGRMTGRDAVIAASTLMVRESSNAGEVRARHPFAFVDDAQELTNAELGLLSAIYGERLEGVTLCGGASSSVSAVRMASRQAAFARAQSAVELRERFIAPTREVYRARSVGEEAAAIADRVAGWLAEGCAPERIAVIFRSVRHIAGYEAALLDREVPVCIAGDLNVFCDRRALDGLALLWSVYDPFRHDWLLRVLSSPAWGLSDATLAVLCSEPPDPQRQLFAFDEEPPPTVRSSRWNPKRDLRLGWNVIRGERDDALSVEAASRLARFRELRESWLDAMHGQPFEVFARRVWRDGLARAGDPHSARARGQQLALRHLLDRLGGFIARNPDATTGGILEYAEQRMESDLESCPFDTDSGFVPILSVEAARGREFDRVVVANVRPGAFPCYYEPEAFLFSPRYGMIAKENAGDSHAARTAKFTYYMFRSKASQHYYERERHAFEYALSRARKSVLVTASGNPIRTATAPEFLEELRKEI